MLGVPHQGSDAAVYARRIATALSLEERLLEVVEPNNEELFAISRDFSAAYGHLDIDIVCYYEQQKTTFGPIKKSVSSLAYPHKACWLWQVVTQPSSAIPGKIMFRLDANHSGMNKFSGDRDPNFKLVYKEIMRIAKGAQGTIKARFDSKYHDICSFTYCGWQQYWLFISSNSTVHDSKEKSIVPLSKLRASLKKYASSDRLSIQRVSGELLSMKHCYINLAVRAGGEGGKEEWRETL